MQIPKWRRSWSAKELKNKDKCLVEGLHLFRKRNRTEQICFPINYIWGSRTLCEINPILRVNNLCVWIIACVKICKIELSAYVPGSLPLNQVLKAKYWVAVISEDPTVSFCVSRKVGWADGPRGRFGVPGAGERGGDREDCNPPAHVLGCCSILHPGLGTASSSVCSPLSCLLGQMHSKVRSLSSPISTSQLSALGTASKQFSMLRNSLTI